VRAVVVCFGCNHRLICEECPSRVWNVSNSLDLPNGSDGERLLLPDDNHEHGAQKEYFKQIDEKAMIRLRSESQVEIRL
jgi:hypothetical protein